jgi:hypothetical protein
VARVKRNSILKARSHATAAKLQLTQVGFRDFLASLHVFLGF